MASTTIKQKFDKFKERFFDEGVLKNCLETVIPTSDYNGTKLTWVAEDTVTDIIDLFRHLLDGCPKYCKKELKEAAETLNLEEWGSLAPYIGNLVANAICSVTISEGTSKVNAGHAFLSIRKIKGWPWGDSD